MASSFLIYGATGFLGEAIARSAVKKGMTPVLGGRNAFRLKALANELGLAYQVVDLLDSDSIDTAFTGMNVVLNCAGPYIHTFQPVVDACINTGVHYIDITGEIPVYKGIRTRDESARDQGVMLLPGAGFDVVPTDCLALHLKERLPTAHSLELAFHSVGPAGLPPGTQRTIIEMIPFGDWVRRNGSLVVPSADDRTRMVNFGGGPILATRVTWGDVYMASFSTGIPNITDYMVLPKQLQKQVAIVPFIRPILKIKAIRELLKRKVKPGPTISERAATVTYVWGKVEDRQGNSVESILRGPEAGTEWTTESALAAVNRVLAGDISPGFQTPATAFGSDFVLECGKVEREDA